MLGWKGLVLIHWLWFIDSCIKDCPALSRSRSFEVPVLEHVWSWVTITKGVISWYQTSLQSEIHAKEGVFLIFSTTVLNWTTAHEAIDRALGADRAGKGLHLRSCMGVLPHATLAKGAKIVQHAILIEVIIVEELLRRFSQNGWLIHSLRRLGIDWTPHHLPSERHASHRILIPVLGFFKKLGSEGLPYWISHCRVDNLHIWLESKIVLVNL